MSSQPCAHAEQIDVSFVTRFTTFLCTAYHKTLLATWQEDTNDETEVREFILESFGHLYRQICMTFPEINPQCYRDYNIDECLKATDAQLHLSQPAKISQLPSRAVFCMA